MSRPSASMVSSQPQHAPISSTAFQHVGTLTFTIKQLSQHPSLADLFPLSLPPPSPTVPVSQVPSLFREPHILSGYRPVGQDWRCYISSLFQRHNESINVWTHLLACPLLLLRWWAYVCSKGHALDLASLPLCIYMVSSLTYVSFSVIAHLLQSHSELAHYSLFFLDYVGVATYQYGSALGHYFYCFEPVFRESEFGVLFLPGAAFLGWLSCAGCCFAKFHYKRPYPPQRKVCQLIPTSLAYLLVISPIAHRLATVPWARDPALPLHTLQVGFFLLCACFFSYPIPERYFPGRCDFIGQGHQIFHLCLSLCTFCQLEALLQDYSQRRDTVVEVFGERQLWFASVSFLILVLFCGVTALLMRRYVQKQLLKRHEKAT